MLMVIAARTFNIPLPVPRTPEYDEYDQEE